MAASEKILGSLHEVVTESLLQDFEAAEAIEDPVTRTLARDKVRAQAITFLKNNNITADPETDKGLAALREKLKNRSNQRPAKATLTEAAEAFAKANGDMLQ
jgi:hypothetical protein